MTSTVDQKHYELRVLRAAADGVHPALLLRAPGKKAEYLFNVPDGFSRLALEHKLIPSARLSCVLFTSLRPASTGGLGGLLLRLKCDGHGQVQMIGPRGSSRVVHSLRHICRWQHPRVFVSECCSSDGDGNGPVSVFEDEHVVIVPLLAGDESTGCPWCLYEFTALSTSDDAEKTSETLNPRKNLDDSGSYSDCSSSSSSSDDETATGSPQSTPGERSRMDSYDETLRVFADGSQMPKQKLDTADKSNPQFGCNIFAHNVLHGCAEIEEEVHSKSNRCQRILSKRRGRGADAAGNQPDLAMDSEDEFFRNLKMELTRAKKAKVLQHSPEVAPNTTSSGPSTALKKVEEHCCNAHVRPADSRPAADTGWVQTSPEVLSLPNVSPPDVGAEEEPVLTSNREGEGTLVSVVPTCSGELDVGLPKRKHIASSNGRNCPDCGNREKDPSSLSHDLASRNGNGHLEVGSLDMTQRGAFAGGRGIVGTSKILPDSEGVAESLNSHALKPYEWRISNLPRTEIPQLPIESNPVYQVSPSGDIAGISSPTLESLSEPNVKNPRAVRQESYEGACPPEILGYICYLRKTQAAFIVAELENVNSLECLERHPALSCLHRASSRCDGDSNVAHLRTSESHFLSAVVHLTPRTVLQCDEYQKWMHSLRTPAHFVMNDRAPEFGFQSSLSTLKRLNRIDGDIFPLPPNLCHFNSRIRPPPEQELARSSVAVLDAEMSMELKFGDEGTVTACFPRLGHSSPVNIEENSVRGPGQTPSEATEEGVSLAAAETRTPQDPSGTRTPSSSALLGEDKSEPSDLVPEQGGDSLHSTSSEFQLVFLGTGCAEPSKKRGSSSILLQIKGARGAMLLDAGEGSAGQLCRRFGYQGARSVISSLQCLWLSHKHGDHVLGVPSILHERSSMQETESLMIIGPRTVYEWLSELRAAYAAAECGYIPRFNYVPCDKLLSSPSWYRNEEQQQNGGQEQIRHLLDAMQLQSLRCVPVMHCYDAYGIVLKGGSGWTVVYSGDTRPCQQLIEAGRGCTVLIHEATFEDSLIVHAKQKKHSTVSEAIVVGSQMSACHLILTHFSQRYPEMVVIDGQHKENVSLAFDGMVVSSGMLNSLGKLLPHMRASFPKSLNSSTIRNSGQLEENTLSVTHRSSWHHQSSAPCEYLQRMGINSISKKGFVHRGSRSSVSNHKRWLSDSDDEEVECYDSSGHLSAPPATSIRWSSDSDEETQGGLPKRAATLSDNSVITSDSCSMGVAPAPPALKVKETEFSNVLDNAYRVKSVATACEASETCGPYGRKHIRWVDSDSEDG